MVDEKRIYQAYYTDSEPIVQYMVNMLDISDNHRILEPSAGHGAFLEKFIQFPVQVDAYEVSTDAIAELKERFGKSQNIKIFHADTLTDERLNHQHYDRVIANPPYGGWLDYDRRKQLKQQYPNFYIKETYSLFLYRCVQLLKPDGKLVFIIPDTWLNLHRHTPLREWLLKNTTLLELMQMPSTFFPKVNFGYASLCILTLQNSRPSDDHHLTIYTDFKNVNQLTEKKSITEISIRQKDIQSNIDSALFISKNSKLMSAINRTKTRIGDIADCVTGFYSGDDKQFLKTSRDHNRYGKVDETMVYQEDTSELHSGLDGEKCYVPIVKGGAAHYHKPDEWFMLWSKAAVQHYRTDKKSRYQNAGYYFKQGLAVPMVSSTQITAALLNHRLFDQSIVGIFPYNESDLWYLLAFFNSPTCNKLIRTINPSANNSAKYIQKIPYITPTPEQSSIIQQNLSIILEQIESKNTFDLKLKIEIDTLISGIYGY